MSRLDSERRRIYTVLTGIFILTLPCYCLGFALLSLDAQRDSLPATQTPPLSITPPALPFTTTATLSQILPSPVTPTLPPTATSTLPPTPTQFIPPTRTPTASLPNSATPTIT